MGTCDILPPRVWTNDFRGCKGCILEASHLGPHRDTSDTHGPIEWADDYECGCCEPDEQDRCIWWGQIALSTERKD